MEVWVAGGIFAVTHALIATDRLDKTVAALLGGTLMIVVGVIDQHQAFAAIDFNVIFLLAGMMILAGILSQTGFFQWLVIRAVKLANGEPFRLMLVLSLVTVGLSAFLDNVTTAAWGRVLRLRGNPANSMRTSRLKVTQMTNSEASLRHWPRWRCPVSNDRSSH